MNEFPTPIYYLTVQRPEIQVGASGSSAQGVTWLKSRCQPAGEVLKECPSKFSQVVG